MTETPRPRPRGWSSAGLVEETDPDTWSVAQAVYLAGPPGLTVTTARRLVRQAGLRPAGKRRMTAAGIAGRHARVYRSAELIELFQDWFNRASPDQLD